MKYRNAKTGAIIDVPCPITGGHWEPVKKPDGKKSDGKKPDGQESKD